MDEHLALWQKREASLSFASLQSHGCSLPTQLPVPPIFYPFFMPSVLYQLLPGNFAFFRLPAQLAHKFMLCDTILVVNFFFFI